MAEPVEFYAYDWTVRRGDTESAPALALLTGAGTEVDLADGWSLRAQVRSRTGELLHTFALGVGIVTGRGRATFPDDDRDPVETATARLRLLPADYDAFPARMRGAVYDLELSRGPDRVRTVMGGALEIDEDVTHD